MKGNWISIEIMVVMLQKINLSSVKTNNQLARTIAGYENSDIFTVIPLYSKNTAES